MAQEFRILVVGGGGREHAIAWALAQHEEVKWVVAAPGNPGIAAESRIAGDRKCHTVRIKADDIPTLIHYAQAIRADMLVVGPEAPLAAGLADEAAKAGIWCFGPTRAGAMLETSKVFGKRFAGNHIPTARWGVMESASDIPAALSFFRPPFVVKEDGLAGGKGTTIAATKEEAEFAIMEKLTRGQVTIEEFLEGEEVTVTAIVSGKEFLLLAESQDHKHEGEGDQGRMTGGMGVNSPAPVVDSAMRERIRHEIVEPTVLGLAADGIPFVGVIYFGLMLTPDGPKLLEYNARLGDPEAQAILMRLGSGLFPLLMAARDGGLSTIIPEYIAPASVCVVLASQGYPGTPKTGDAISGTWQLSQKPWLKVFHAGTAIREGKLVTAGGRVLGITAIGGSIEEAAARATSEAAKLNADGMWFRRDIAHRAITHELAGRG